MRIAIFHDLPSGGAKRALLEQVRGLSSHHNIDVYSYSSADHTFCDLRPFIQKYKIYQIRDYQLFGSPLGRLNQIQRWRQLVEIDNLSRQVSRDIDAGGYDLVFVHPSRYTQAPPLLKYLRTVSVYYVHEPLRQVYEPELIRPYQSIGFRKKLDRIDPFIGLYRNSLKKLDRESCHGATYLLTNSQFTAGNIQKYYGRKAEVLYLGIDLDLFKPLTNVRKTKYLLSVGSIQSTKGFDLLIRALACIPESSRPPLQIVGNSENKRELNYLEDLAARVKVRVKFETMISNESLIRYYNQAYLVGYCPVQEPFGLVPLEAIACGTPVIGVAEGGVCETILHGETGWLVDRDPQKFADCIQKMLNQPDIVSDMGIRGRDWVCKQWNWEKSNSSLEEFLAGVMVNQ